MSRVSRKHQVTLPVSVLKDAGRLVEVDLHAKDMLDPIGIDLDRDRLERTGIDVRGRGRGSTRGGNRGTR